MARAAAGSIPAVTSSATAYGSTPCGLPGWIPSSEPLTIGTPARCRAATWRNRDSRVSPVRSITAFMLWE